MSSYTTRVLQDNPTHYFAADNGTANQIGSETITLTTGTSLTFPTTGGIKNSGYIQAAGNTAATAQLKWTDSAVIYDDKVFTVSGWFNVATGDVAAGNNARFFSISASSLSGSELFLALNKDSNNANAYVVAQFYNQQIGATIPSASIWGKWKHFAFTSDGTNIKLYIDGSLASTGSVPTGSISLNSRSKYFFNTDVTGVSTQRKGKWDELTVFNTALTPATILDHYNAYINASYTAEVGTASGIINDVTVTHDKLTVLAPADSAAYIFPLESNLSQMSGPAMSGKTFTTTGSPSIISKSVSGGVSSVLGNQTLTYAESSAPVFASTQGVTVEAVFKHNQLSGGVQKILYGKRSNAGYAINLSIKNVAGGTVDVIGADFQTSSSPAYVSSGTPLVDGQWYHVVATWKTPDDSGNADNTVRLYINNVLDTQSGNFTNSGNYFDTNNDHYFDTHGQWLDYVAVYSHPYNGAYLNATKRTQHYQAVLDGIDALTNHIETPITAYAYSTMPGGLFTKNADVSATALTASGEAVNPYAIYITHGQGGPMEAAAEIVMPIGFGSVNRPGGPLIAFGTFPDPTIIARRNVTVSATALTAAAEMIHSSHSHESGLSVSTLYADADIVEPIVFIAGLVRANAMIASCLFPTVAVETERNGLYKPKAMTAKAKFSLPPAYRLLADDPYYRRLFEQHATITEEAPFTGASSLPNQQTKAVLKSFLKFFNDVDQDITIESTNKLTSELPQYIFYTPGQFEYDSNGNILPLNTTKIDVIATGLKTATPTPKLEIGYLDPYERTAVKVQNIEFAYPENRYISDRSYSLEFSIKTTKSSQIIAYGRKTPYEGYTNIIGVIGLYNGKIYSMTSSDDKFITPANRGKNNYLLGNKNIADGEWHHVIVQYGYDDTRTQYWIDGQLDRQMINSSSTIGNGIGSTVRPYVMGYNSTNSELSSEFYTSAWSYDPGRFADLDNVGLNYIAYSQSTPISVDAMSATAAMTADNLGRGNRARALMLYFWSTRSPAQDFFGGSYYFNSTGGYDSSGARQTQFDQGLNGEFDFDTFFPLSTWEGRKELFDWDVFPVDVSGRYVSQVVKPESYKYPFDIKLTAEISEGFKNEFDESRYIDILNDINDIGSFDMICFRNFPDQGTELDSFTRNEDVDTYFGIKESKIYQDFLTGIRAAVDQGISLYVSNPQLAIDLGIIDRVETITDLNDEGVTWKLSTQELGDAHSISRVIAGTENTTQTYSNGYFDDTYKNNVMRVVNTVTGLTDEPGFILKEYADYTAVDERSFAEPNRHWAHVENKPNGLAVGDEFVWFPMKNIQAVPMTAVKAGKVITACADSYWRDNTELENPFKNYALTIAVEPGDVLNGTQCGGKIFVNFAEPQRYTQNEDTVVELKTAYWINKAFNEGAISEIEKTDYLTDEDINLDLKLANLHMTQQEYDYNTYWQLNGNHYIAAAVDYGKLNRVTVYSNSSGNVISKRKALSTRGRRKGVDTGTGAGSLPGFTVEWGHTFPVTTLRTIGMISRGMWWLSERSAYFGEFVKPLAFTAQAALVDPVVTGNKNVSVIAAPMYGTSKIVEIGLIPDTEVRAMPMTAAGRMLNTIRPYFAAPMTAAARMTPDSGASSYEIDRIVLYVMHEDPILYVREDVIK